MGIIMRHHSGLDERQVRAMCMLFQGEAPAVVISQLGIHRNTLLAWRLSQAWQDAAAEYRAALIAASVEAQVTAACATTVQARPRREYRPRRRAGHNP